MIKRVALFILTNLAVLTVITIILNIFNIQPYLTQFGLDYKTLLIYALAAGFGGSLISLFSSKAIALKTYNIQLIDKPTQQSEVWLMGFIQKLAQSMRITMPQVGIYESPEPNAFATGWNKNKALVAVSSSLLQAMDREEVEGVLGHELSHAANGDMVTMALLQGVAILLWFFWPGSYPR